MKFISRSGDDHSEMELEVENSPVGVFKAGVKAGLMISGQIINGRCEKNLWHRFVRCGCKKTAQIFKDTRIECEVRSTSVGSVTTLEKDEWPEMIAEDSSDWFK